jgi:AraC-like DNA-binding protein
MSAQVLLYGDRIPLVRGVGYNKTSSMWTHPRRCLDFNVYLYISSGQFQVCEEGREYVIKEGETFFLAKGLNHWGEPKTTPGTSWYWVHFVDIEPGVHSTYGELNSAHSFKKVLEPEDHRFTMPLPKLHKVAHPELLIKRLNVLLDLYKGNDPLRTMLLGLKTAELLLELYKESTLVEKRPKTEITVKKVIDYLSSVALDGKFDAASVAEHVHMNYNYVSSIFTERTGMSISNYYTRLRIDKAMELMRNPALNISEIGQLLGFSSPYHFSLVFKKTYGISPSDYMKQIYREAQADPRAGK